MGASLDYSLEACIRAWRNRRPVARAASGEALADSHFSRGEFEAAAAAFAECEPQTEQIRAKRGWCLGVVGRCEEASQFLTPENCGSSSAELAVLAAVVAGDWSRKKLYGGSGVSAEAAQAQRECVEELVQRALHGTNQPDQLAFFAYIDLVEWYEDREAALVEAERAIALYKVPGITEWHVRLLRMLKRPTDTAFNALLTQVPDNPWPTYVEEMFESALALSRYDDACGALDVLEEKLRPAQYQTFETRLGLLRAHVDLRRALDADPGAAVRGLAVADTLHGQLIGIGPLDLLLFAAKLRLALAVAVQDEAGIRESANSISDTAWSADSAPDYPLSCEIIWVGGVSHGAEFGGGYSAPEVLASLSPDQQLKWTLLNALRSINDDEDPDGHARAFIALHGPDRAPAWAAETVADILLSSTEIQARNVGRALARCCLHYERRDGSYASPPGLNYDDLSAPQASELVDGILDELRRLDADAGVSGRLLLKELGSALTTRKAYQPLMQLSDLVLAKAADDTDALFYAALARQELKQLGAARSLYERFLELDQDCRAAYWNILLIHEAQGNADAIEEMLPVLEEHAEGGAQTWIEARDRARTALSRARQHQATTDFRAFVSRELAAFPALRTTPSNAHDLSLLDAACLVALLRASDLNHSTWTLTAFAKSSRPFEPTFRFRRSLLDLATKGIIRIADDTPIEAFVAKDGRLRFYLDKMHWSISPHTLALQREIRDMARDHWPEHWSAHAEVLSRDLATEECVAYMKYLAEERKLDPPDQTEARALFRELLEHCSVGKCWYYIYSGVQSANDYRTKYPVSRAQVTAMMLKRTRERGEIAIARGWDTAYSRIRALPRSHLSAALHDVLTGWGERAFEEPIRALADPAST